MRHKPNLHTWNQSCKEQLQLQNRLLAGTLPERSHHHGLCPQHQSLASQIVGHCLRELWKLKGSGFFSKRISKKDHVKVSGPVTGSANCTPAKQEVLSVKCCNPKKNMLEKSRHLSYKLNNSDSNTNLTSLAKQLAIPAEEPVTPTEATGRNKAIRETKIIRLSAILHPWQPLSDLWHALHACRLCEISTVLSIVHARPCVGPTPTGQGDT